VEGEAEGMNIEIGHLWGRVDVKPFDLNRAWNEQHVPFQNYREVRIIVIETCFVLIEEVCLPKHPEYGFPRRWIPIGAFVNWLVVEGVA
jgi:hypothetical protein